MKTLKILTLAALSFSVLSCEKEQKADNTIENPSHTDQDIALSMNFDSEITNLAQVSIEENYEGKKSTTWRKCAQVSIDTTGPTNTITLDFGTTNCLGNDGRLRRGKLFVTFVDNPFDVGSITSISSTNYTVDEHLIVGSQVLTFKGFKPNSDPYLSLVSNLVITKPNKTNLTWTSTQERVWTDGYGNLNPFDNAVEVTGNASGTVDSISFNIQILTPLRVEATCSNVVSGSFDLSSPSFFTRTFDYGNGACDRVATVTILGQTFTFLL